MKRNRFFLIAGIVLSVGVIVFIAGFAMLGFDYKAMTRDGEYSELTCATSDEISKVVVSDDNADITLAVSTDDETHITYMENDKSAYSVKTDNGVLEVTKQSSKKWYDYILSFSFTRPTVTVALPASFDGTVNITDNNGNIYLESVHCNSVYAKTDNHDVTLNDCDIDGTVYAKTSNGNVKLYRVTAGDITCETSNGKVILSNINAGEISTMTSNGRIDISHVKSASLTARTHNGEISLSNTDAEQNISAETHNQSIRLESVGFGGELFCNTGNGSITGTVCGSLGDFSFDCDTSNGNCNLPNDIQSGDRLITAHTSNGNINISFTD